MSIVKALSREQSYRLKKLARNPSTPAIGRRALAVLRLSAGISAYQVAEQLHAAPSSVYRWARWFREDGVRGLMHDTRGRRASTVSDELKACVLELIDTPPQTLGYLRSTWSSELLALALRHLHGFAIHASTVRRVLPTLGIVWRRARPTLNRKDPRKAEKLAAIDDALARCDARTAVFYVDEVDIDLLPRIGFGWRRRGKNAQSAVVTPGQNEKHYVAGALHAGTGKLVWVDGFAKNTALFIRLLEAIRERYRGASRIVLVLDNYRIHKAETVQQWLAENPKFELCFQSVYYPWVNQIERLWKAMHDTVTRNHQCKALPELCRHIMAFFDAVQPFPGNGHGVSLFGSAI